jgi:hypothetical protein
MRRLHFNHRSGGQLSDISRALKISWSPRSSARHASAWHAVVPTNTSRADHYKSGSTGGTTAPRDKRMRLFRRGHRRVLAPKRALVNQRSRQPGIVFDDSRWPGGVPSRTWHHRSRRPRRKYTPGSWGIGFAKPAARFHGQGRVERRQCARCGVLVDHATSAPRPHELPQLERISHPRCSSGSRDQTIHAAGGPPSAI